jgi:hypothetical protein
MSLVDTINSINSVTNALNGGITLTTGQNTSLQQDGFLLPAAYNASANGLPYDQVQPFANATSNRNIITWFVPQFGIVSMYVNPNSITYAHKKLITEDRTKGGFTLQYWGEDLIRINIVGTTGSSGIEGINALYEVYRGEQFAFDTVGLTLDANNYNSSLSSNLLNGAASLLGASNVVTSPAAGVGGLLGGILGIDSSYSTLSAYNIPSLAQLAFTVEMYYNGWVYRGYFQNMTINEQSNDFLIGYQMTFVATQKRGYRTNYFPWSKSANNGPSSPTTPTSFSGYVGQ